MRVDVVTIFPEYLAPLGLSLAGKARDAGLLDVHVHDLRTWTHDRHRTVDDTPYGGGAGMVMKPEPWGEALDAVLPDGATLVVPSPSGEPLRQALARELAGRDHLVVACGRYEGIDQRVVEDAASRTEVREVSVGDYVLNGGEAAALVIVEAVARLLPGFMGNPDSLLEESHEDGLLEYPVYTRPATWRGHEVPPVLLSGDHGAIAAWRHEQAVRRTAERRPDLAHPARAVAVGDLDALVARASAADVGELQTLQWACLLQPSCTSPARPSPTTWSRRPGGSSCASAAAWSAPSRAACTTRARPGSRGRSWSRPTCAAGGSGAGSSSHAEEMRAARRHVVPPDDVGDRASATSGSTARRATGPPARPLRASSGW